MKVQRWTGLVSANDLGGFVSAGDYMELAAELAAIKGQPIVGWKHTFEDGQTRLSYSKTTAGFPPRPGAKLIQALIPLPDAEAMPMTSDEAFEIWWANEGSGVPPGDRDVEEHTKRMCSIAWANGKYCAEHKEST